MGKMKEGVVLRRTKEFSYREGGNFELQEVGQKTLIWSVVSGNHLNNSIKGLTYVNIL